MYIKRTIENFLQQASRQFPVILITGPRQIGKTTVLQHLSKKNRTYVTLDDPNLVQLAKTEPELFLQRFTPPVLIDEIQYAPQLLPYIKMHVDKTKVPGAFWLTGSQQFELMHGIQETLAGRVGIIKLLGFSLRELQRKTQKSEIFLPTSARLAKRLQSLPTLSLQDVYSIIWRGAFPAMWASGSRVKTGSTAGWRNLIKTASVDRDLFYGSYVQTYLQRDIRALVNVSDADKFLKFLRAVAARTGQLLNMADMARDVGVSPMTGENWLSLLKTSGIIYLLEPYHNNISKRFIKTPKLYFLDTGLCAYLTEWSSPETLEAGAMSGAILETFIFTEILKSYWHNGKSSAPLYFYRDKDKKEIDLLIVQGDTIYPLEFKKTANLDQHAAKNFQVLRKLKKPIGEGGVICLVSTLLPIADKISVIPLSCL